MRHECLTRLGAPGLGAGLCKGATQPGASMSAYLAVSLQCCHFWPPLSCFFFFSALHPERILEARKPNGHGFLFDMERKKKQREKAQHLYVSLRILSERASHSECQLGAKDLRGVWGQ